MHRLIFLAWLTRNQLCFRSEQRRGETENCPFLEFFIELPRQEDDTAVCFSGRCTKLSPNKWKEQDTPTCLFAESVVCKNMPFKGAARFKGALWGWRKENVGEGCWMPWMMLMKGTGVWKKKEISKNNCFKAFVKGKMCVDQVVGRKER